MAKTGKSWPSLSLTDVMGSAEAARNDSGGRDSSQPESRGERNPCLAVIIPYRDRAAHLDLLLPAITAFLEDRAINHTVLIVEQNGSRPFNRGKLLNVGFRLTEGDSTYVCFHDVDLMPEGSECDYSPVPCPTQLAVYSPPPTYQFPWEDPWGGVTLFPRQDFERANGFSNGYWGWGAEDNDLQLRCRRIGLEMDQRPGRYTALWHPPRGDNTLV